MPRKYSQSTKRRRGRAWNRPIRDKSSNKWLYKWKSFITNQVTLNNFFDNEEWAASVNMSLNPDIGVLPPGIISNEEDFFI